jgi:hypothetical protein
LCDVSDWRISQFNIGFEELEKVSSRAGLEISGMSGIRFSLGSIMATPGALSAFGLGSAQVSRSTHRRRLGDVDKHDQRENELSLQHGFRLLSAYTLKNGTRIWIITEADRSATTVLLPDEY